jgi:hypothetical protein
MGINFNAGIEPGNLAELEQCVNEWAWLVPPWVQELWVNVQPHDTNVDSIATTWVREQYREVTLHFRPNWFIEAKKQRHLCVIHELLHITANPLYNFTRNVISKLADGEGEGGIILSEAEDYVERQVCDLSMQIYRRFYE